MMLETESKKANAVTWNRRVTQNPERYGTTPEHVRKVEKKVRDLLAEDEKAMAKLSGRADRTIMEGGE